MTKIVNLINVNCMTVQETLLSSSYVQQSIWPGQARKILYKVFHKCYFP